MRTPDFDDLVGRDLPPEERERLRRVHELLVRAGPPAEVPPSLAELPAPGRGGGEVVKLRIPPRVRVGLLAAAALTALAFGAGYFAGHRGGESAGAFRAIDVVRLQPVERNSNAVAVVRLGPRHDDGNWTMIVTVEGLRHVPKGDYYVLYMTKNGERIVSCGTFNAAGGVHATTVRFNVAYDRSRFDGWSITRYRHPTRSEREVLRV